MADATTVRSVTTLSTIIDYTYSHTYSYAYAYKV